MVMIFVPTLSGCRRSLVPTGIAAVLVAMAMGPGLAGPDATTAKTPTGSMGGAAAMGRAMAGGINPTLDAAGGLEAGAPGTRQEFATPGSGRIEGNMDDTGHKARPADALSAVNPH